MTLTTEARRNYLAALGIDVYLCRPKTAVALTPLTGRVTAWFAVGQPAAVDPRFRTLFGDFALALGARPDMICWTDAASGGLPRQRVLLNFGTLPIDGELAETEIKLPNPENLSASASAKRAAWSALKPILKAAQVKALPA